MDWPVNCRKDTVKSAITCLTHTSPRSLPIMRSTSGRMLITNANYAEALCDSATF
jgi:hypothetical protein